MISNKDIRVEGSNIVINGEKHPLDPAVIALTKRANIVQGKLSALDTRIDAIEALEKTASGNPISLTGVAAAYAISNTMTIEPIQDLHGYSKPWPAGGGKNIANPDTLEVGFYLTAGYQNNPDYKTTAPIAVENGQTYSGSLFNSNDLTERYNTVITTFSSGDTTNAIRQVVGEESITIQPGESYVRIRNYSAQTPLILSGDFYYQLEKSASATAYEPYSNICPISGLTSGEVSTTNGEDTNAATITFGQTVYGGSVNFKTGEVTVTHGIVDLGSLSWRKEGSYYEYRTNLLANMKAYADNVKANALCSVYAILTANQTYHAINKGLSIANTYISIGDNNYETSADITSALSGVQLCYELATPTTLTLTPAELELLKGSNTISGNGVTINISYLGR